MPAQLRIDAERVWTSPGELLSDGSVVVGSGELVYVGPRDGAPEAEEVRRAAFLAPGFHDMHVHVGLSDPRAMLAGGVTRARDLGWPLAAIEALARRSRAAGFQGPLIEFCGPMLTAPGGYPTDRAWAPAGTGLEVAGAKAARAAVERVLGAGAAAVKVALNAAAGAVLGRRELAAICESAHGSGRDVIAHVEGEGQVERALEAGVDELAHAPWSAPLEPGLIGELAGRCRVVSTLEMHAANGDRGAFEVAAENLRRFRAAGGRVLYGTDLGNGRVAPGISAGELAALAALGFENEELLAMCATAPLRRGAPAELVCLRGNPLDDLTAFGEVALVVRGEAILAAPDEGRGR